MKYLSIYFYLLVIVLFSGCGKGDDEFPIETVFDGKFLFNKNPGEIFAFDQTGVSQITNGCSPNFCQKEHSQWVYPGDKVVYHLTWPPSIAGYYLIDEDGNNNHLLVLDGPTSNRYSSDVSADGQMFACFSDEELDIYQIHSGILKIVDSVEWHGDGAVQFSPNNELVLLYDYPAIVGINLGIHRIDQPGIINYAMTSGDYSIETPNFSYLSDKIVFMYDKAVWVIQSDGTGAEIIISNDDYLITSPVWSPVEDCIAYSRTRYKHKNKPSEVVLFNYHSKIESLILSDENINFVTDIKWSADGQQLAFHNIDEPNLGTFIINKDGSALKRISKEQFPYHDWFTE